MSQGEFCFWKTKRYREREATSVWQANSFRLQTRTIQPPTPTLKDWHVDKRNKSHHKRKHHHLVEEERTNKRANKQTTNKSEPTPISGFFTKRSEIPWLNINTRTYFLFLFSSKLYYFQKLQQKCMQNKHHDIFYIRLTFFSNGMCSMLYKKWVNKQSYINRALAWFWCW